MNKLPALSEKMIQTQIINYLEAKGWYTMRMNSGKYAVGEGMSKRYIRGHRAGTPDVMAFKRANSYAWEIPNPELLFVEVKKEGKKPTKLQERTMQEITDHGGKCIVAHSLDELIMQLEGIGMYEQTR